MRAAKQMIDYFTTGDTSCVINAERPVGLHPAQLQLAAMLGKLCYQAARGAEHLLTGLDRARGYLLRGFEATPADESIPLIEPISDTVARVNIAPWKARGLSPDTLFDLFAATAQVNREGEDCLPAYLEEAGEWIAATDSTITTEAWQNFLAWYRENGYPAVHHSEAYRKSENPAYRIVLRVLLTEAGIDG